MTQCEVNNNWILKCDKDNLKISKKDFKEFCDHLTCYPRDEDVVIQEIERLINILKSDDIIIVEEVEQDVKQKPGKLTYESFCDLLECLIKIDKIKIDKICKDI